MQINQFVAGIAPGDAVTNHALEIQKCLRGWGISSEIYAPPQHVSPECRGLARDYRDYAPGNGASAMQLYHFSIGSELSRFVPRLPGRKVMIYHNITPHAFFLKFSGEKALAAFAGREQLHRLAPQIDLALGDSEYNRRELTEAGYAKTAVLPLFVETRLENESSAAGGREPGKEVNFLFVGRFVPNKKFEDVIRAFVCYQKTIRAESRLFLVGPTQGFERYVDYLRQICRDLGAQNVIFTGRVSEEEKNRLYREADLFLCMSEHEGFCLPLLEAMRFDLPVVAYAAAAVPETLGGAGILVREKNFPQIAELAEKIIVDTELKKNLLAGQRRRLADFERSKVEAKLKECLGI